MYSINILNRENTAFSKILDPQDLSFKLTLGGKDKAKFSLPLSHPRAEKENLKKHNRIEVYRMNPKDRTDVRKVWVGYIEAVRIVDDNHLEVGCNGFLQLLEKRTVSRSFTNWEGGAAVFELLNTNVNVEDDTFISAGVSDVDKIFSHDFADMKALKAWQKIGEATGGELQVDTDFRLNFKNQIGEDRISTVIFRFIRNLQNANSIDNFTLLEEGKELFNRITCYGKNRVVTSVKEDIDSIDDYGLLEKVRHFTQIEDQSTLDEVAQELLDFHNPVKVIPTIEPNKGKIDLFEYGVGDRVRVVIKHALLDFDQVHRILEVDVTVGRNNEEKIKIKIAKEGVHAVKNDEEQLADLTQRVEDLES